MIKQRHLIIESEDHNPLCPYVLDICYDAYQSFSRLNWRVGDPMFVLNNVSMKMLDIHNFHRLNVYVGSVSFIQKVANKLAFNLPAPLNIPSQIESFADRKIWYGYKKDITGVPIFLKPADEVKLFTGGVITKMSTLDFMPEIKDDTRLMFSEVEDFTSEYRCFVYKGKIVGMKHYNGDFFDMPDAMTMTAAVQAYTLGPVAYTIDFGVTKGGKTKLIEVNDYWACGTYGFVCEENALMIRDRWYEIIEQGSLTTTI
jgi:hypothetical protein